MGLEAEPPEEVLGWQPLVLARPQRCDACGNALEKGEQALAEAQASLDELEHLDGPHTPEEFTS